MIEIDMDVFHAFLLAVMTFNALLVWRSYHDWNQVSALQNEMLELQGLTNAVKAEYEAALLRANDLRQQLESGIAIANGEAWQI